MNVRKSSVVCLLAVLAIFGLGVRSLEAADIKVQVDTPTSFKATFTGMDTDPYSLAGNDFIVVTFEYWTVLLNLRGDAVAGGLAAGFYEIRVVHNGSKDLNPGAPGFSNFLVYSGLPSGVVLTHAQASSTPHGVGTDQLSTSIGITFDDAAGVTLFDGVIEAEADDDGDGKGDGDKPTDELINDLQALRDEGKITGEEMGDIIKQMKRPIKKS